MQQSEYCQINPMQLIVQVCAVISFPTFIFNFTNFGLLIWQSNQKSYGFVFNHQSWSRIIIGYGTTQFGTVPSNLIFFKRYSFHYWQNVWYSVLYQWHEKLEPPIYCWCQIIRWKWTLWKSKCEWRLWLTGPWGLVLAPGCIPHGWSVPPENLGPVGVKLRRPD